jgi:cyclopropane-fatty-acyl-phospholipid synthase
MSVKQKVVEGLSSGAVRSLFDRAGLVVDGPNSWDPQVNDSAFFETVGRDGILGLGDSYISGAWDCSDLFRFFSRILSAGLLEQMAEAGPMVSLVQRFAGTNPQTLERARDNISRHYDLSNRLFGAFLGSSMAYTCARWESPSNINTSEGVLGGLDRAQWDKHENICDKLGLESGMKVLDLGCGWGPFMMHAAIEHDVLVTGVTLSGEQANYIHIQEKASPSLSSLIEVIQDDYRNLGSEHTAQYDRVVSIGMFEHVGRKNLGVALEIMNRCLKPGGIAFTHFFGRSNEKVPLVDPWTEKYIFPAIDLCTVAQVTRAAESVLDLRDLEEIGIHYVKTLLAWHDNFVANWATIEDSFDEQFHRMWRYYLLSAAAAFFTRKILLWQMVWTKVEDIEPSAILCPRI